MASRTSLPPDASARRFAWAAWGLLALAVGVVYQEVRSHGFVNFDDPMFLYENSHVRAGLTGEGLRWAWTNKDAVLWQPVAWMGHMAVSALAGMQPTPHLLVNVGLHFINAGLLFALLRELTGAQGRSLAVALLFAVHPVNVETVAWASQLKSTLSTFFFLLGVLAYARRLGTATETGSAVLLAFAASLLAKPMLLFFPAILVLLDAWRRPPEHEARAEWGGWVRPKLPFVVLTALVLLMTVVPWTAPAAADLAPVQAPEARRWLAVPCNYVAYLRLYFWPTDLAVLYPEVLDHSVGEAVACAGLLGLLSRLAWRERRRRPALWFGWVWFGVTMIPASGLLRAGPHGLADRYLYVPGIGLLVAVIWLGAEGIRGRSRGLGWLAVAGLAWGLGWQAQTQVSVWRDSVSLWQHAAAVTPPSATRHINLGNALLEAGREREAEVEFNAAIRLAPLNPRPHVNLAVIAQRRGEPARAIAWLRQALALAPTDARILSNLGALLDDVGEKSEARRSLERALRLQPNLAEAWINLGVIHAQSGEFPEALACLEGAARLRPGDPTVERNLHLVRRQLGGAVGSSLR